MVVVAEGIAPARVDYAAETQPQALARTCSLAELWQMGEATGRLYQQRPDHALSAHCADIWAAIRLLAAE